MKTRNYITVAVAIAGVMIGADAQARSSRPVHHHQPVYVVPARPARPVRVVPAPSVRSRSVFIHIAPPLRVTHHVVAAPAPRPIFVPTPAPIVIGPPSVTIWISNANGSRSSVVLMREGPWYVGPRGEYYATLPTESQLRPIYGISCEPLRSDTVGVYITTNSGALRLVTLIRTQHGFVGPNGELYHQMPTEGQLRMLYGR